MRGSATSEAPPREAEVSRQRQQQAREQVIEPLRTAAAQNNFAELIRASLIQGHRNGGAG